MRAFSRIVFLLSVAVLQLVGQDNPQATMKGIVSGEGKPIQSAFVALRDFEQSLQSSHTWETRTLLDGSFSLLVPPDRYDIFVSANAQFLPMSKRVCVQAAGTAVVRIKLKADPHPRLHLD
jgi:hypothetical protein